MGMIEDFPGFEIFNSGAFLGGKICQVLFGWFNLSRDFLGEDLWQCPSRSHSSAKKK